MFKIRKVGAFLLVLCCLITALIFGVFTSPFIAEAKNVSDATSLNKALSDFSSLHDTQLVIDGDCDIDYRNYEHNIINLSNTKFEGKELSVLFNVGVTNVFNTREETYVHDQIHYGLFSSTTPNYVPIYYKISFDAGEGQVENAVSSYMYGRGLNQLPNVIAPEGKTFKKWINAGDEEEKGVTSITNNEWGIKTLVAVYEDSEPEEGGEVSPATYEIVYTDDLFSMDFSTLETTFTVGEKLVLATLENTGYVFKGWKVLGCDVVLNELPSELPLEYIYEDNKIHLRAVWEPEHINPEIITLRKLSEPTISKVYDGTTDAEFDFVRGVHYEVDGLPTNISITTNAYYEDSNAGENKVLRLEVAVEDESCVFEGNDYLLYSASITKSDIVPKIKESPVLTKVYDGTLVVPYAFEFGKEYVLDGVVDEEIVGVNVTAQYGKSSVGAQKVVLLFGDLIFKSGVNAENYNYESGYNELYFDASITPLTIEVSGEDLTKVYGDSENLSDVIKTGIGNESITIRYNRAVGEDVGKYVYLGFNSENCSENYEVVFVSKGRGLAILPKVPKLNFPSFKEANFNPTGSLKDLEVYGESLVATDVDTGKVIGKFEWQNGDIIPFVINEGYPLTFIPSDTRNYNYSGLEGYNPEDSTITRKVVVNILSIDPTPTSLDERFSIAQGRRFDSIELSEGWSLVESEEVLLTKPIMGEAGNATTYPGALVYEKDNTGNYNKIYRDLVIDHLLPVVIYKHNGEMRNSVSQTEVTVSETSTVNISFALENPFGKVGYEVAEWRLGGGTIITTEGGEYLLGSTFVWENVTLNGNVIEVDVAIKPRNDIKITFRHFYENLEGAFTEENVDLKERNDGVSDTVYTILESDIFNRYGFNFGYACIGESDERITSFVVSPLGDSVINLYYFRLRAMVNYRDKNHQSLAHVGSLPSSKEVIFGVPFALDTPSDYKVLGYSFLGYQDGFTYDGESLKTFEVSNPYVLERETSTINFEVVFRPNTDTQYLVKKYLNGNESVEVRNGTTGSQVDISNEEVEGYERVANEGEKLTGTITGYLLDANNSITHGEMLELIIYYVAKKYNVTIGGNLGISDIIATFGESVTLPNVPGEQPENVDFLGWIVNGTLYGAGESFIMPAGNVIIEPKWSAPDSEPSEPEEGETSDDLDNEVQESEEDGLGIGGIVGIAVGAVVLVGVAVGLGIGLSLKKKKKAREALEENISRALNKD